MLWNYSTSYIKWNLQGRKSYGQVAVQQQNCLSNWVAQGVMAHRSYRLQKPLNPVAFQKLIDRARSAGQLSKDNAGVYCYGVNSPSLEIVGFTYDLPVWDGIVAEAQALKP